MLNNVPLSAREQGSGDNPETTREAVFVGLDFEEDTYENAVQGCGAAPCVSSLLIHPYVNKWAAHWYLPAFRGYANAHLAK